MSTSVTFHGVTHIRASTTGTQGAPLSLTIHSENRMSDSISIFTDDQVLTDRLIEAINAVVDQRWHETRVIEARISNEAQVYDALHTEDV